MSVYICHFIFSIFDESGAVTVLPTILHLTTSVARELASRSSGTEVKVKAPTVVAACLQSLKQLCTSTVAKDTAVSSDWTRLLQSAVATVLHDGKPG
jgi:hypothetical protein